MKKGNDILTKEEIDALVRDYLRGGDLYLRHKEGVDMEQLLTREEEVERINALLFEYWSEMPCAEPTARHLEVLRAIKALSGSNRVAFLRRSPSGVLVRYVAVVAFMLVSSGIATYLYLQREVQAPVIVMIEEERDRAVAPEKMLPEEQNPLIASAQKATLPATLPTETVEEPIEEVAEPIAQVSEEVVVKKDKTVTHKVDEGMSLEVVLPDGSLVTLYGGSSLSYKEGFEQTARVVNLEGKAHFAVAKDAARPMEVRTPALSVHVLGTEFDVDAYPDYGHTVVVLSKGSVNVSTHEGNVHTMKVGEELSYDHHTKKVNIAKTKKKC